MSQPLGPGEDLVRRIGSALLTVAPQGWRQVRAEYRAAGLHVEADVFVTGADGTLYPVQPPPEAVALFGQLRTGMYQAGRGTWLSALYLIESSGAYHVDFEPDVEPRWRRPPPPLGFQDELRFFPRNDEHIPGWWRQRAGLPPAPPPSPPTATPAHGVPQPPAPARATPAAGDWPQGDPPPPDQQRGLPATADNEVPMRTPRVYDGLDASGRPVVDREPLSPAERERTLAYLEAAPVVLAARSYAPDAFAPDEAPEVPMNFRTDGAWVWPGAVTYYLRKHDVPPDPELLAHIRDRGFAVPDVNDAAKDLAVSTVIGEPPPAPTG
jgi:hypothetical protein